MKYTIVIARYNENLDYISFFDPEKYDIIIYNKGKDNLPYPSIKLKNIGRESETFIRHIVDNYNNLTEFIILLQGDPYHHCENFIEMISRHTNEKFVALTNHIINFGIIYNDKYAQDCKKLGETKKYERLGVIAERLLEDEIPRNLFAGQGAQYILAREVIQRRSLEYYKYILDLFPKNCALSNHLERLWPYIFKESVLRYKYLDYKIPIGY